MRRTVDQIDELLRMRAAADWLEATPQFGVSVFARGKAVVESGISGRQGTYFSLMEACLGVLERELVRVETYVPVYRINLPAYWRVTDALALVRKKIREGTAQNIWKDCMPARVPAEPVGSISRRATVAATFVAGLELVRQGEMSAKQMAFLM
ncbi:ring hydroxylating dioxygenase subunit alpha [Komagataeibacter intermedius AF2]|uniref:Ring hydroxylating dioxygenase subunit alpha n=1 Tax=Komagataeibacter intermedius AF2 TaxID=1458464 RepID=A0A0N1F8J1_9PROT|nr:ring hydroxylating dioxygenase subunit alpha [Komagataeibacter intermedius AF2]